MGKTETFLELHCSGAERIGIGECFSVPGFLPEPTAGVIEAAPRKVEGGLCFTVVQSGCGIWSFVSGCGERLYRLSFRIRGMIRRGTGAVLRKIRTYCYQAKTVMRPAAPLRLRL